ncbi:hypothetical protein RS82_02005 [Microbacterium trichothecenolyticum]|uniref:PKD domain-containing protein n=1 Tax=Microbacterium trichothecenolyticum TaxID=69370 RepID=A0A0M2HCN7_MICTR|nr:hypothetical protein RS82_02005 [Microbacterium trichothecenolyticum]
MLIVAAITTFALSLAPAMGSATSNGCTASQLQAGLCSYTTDKEAVVSGTDTQKGSGGEAVDNEPRSNPGAAPRPEAPAEPEDCGPLNRCENYVVAGPPDVTLADLASFRPAQPTLGGEPAGFGVVGMPTNLLASASEQRIPGTVLGWDVTVRFVPVAYVFDNGDGTTTRASTGGASWTALGQGQFTPTATSHAYRARGTYPVSVTVEYEASVDFGSGTWRTVPGVVRAEAAGYGVRVVEVRTALVDRTCVEDPTGPGC